MHACLSSELNKYLQRKYRHNCETGRNTQCAAIFNQVSRLGTSMFCLHRGSHGHVCPFVQLLPFYSWTHYMNDCSFCPSYQTIMERAFAQHCYYKQKKKEHMKRSNVQVSTSQPAPNSINDCNGSYHSNSVQTH